jgi:hypothetical protein
MRRGTSSLLFAIALHAGLLAFVVSRPVGRREVTRPEERPPVPIELEPEQLGTTQPAPAAPEQAPPAKLAAVAPAVAGLARQARAEPAPSAPDRVAPPEPSPPHASEAAPQPPPGYQVMPPGLGGTSTVNPFLTAAFPDVPAKDDGAARAIRRTLDERDRGLGLGASGPVVAALEDVARTSTAEVESRAVFEVVADGEGAVVSVSVVEVNATRGAWEGVARSLLDAMRGKRVRVRRGSRGVAMTIAIESRETMPSGAAPGVNVTLFDQKVHSGKNDRASSVSILPLAKMPITVPVPGQPGVTKTIIVVLPVPVPEIGAAYDLSDIGAKAARVVHAHAVTEEEL